MKFFRQAGRENSPRIFSPGMTPFCLVPLILLFLLASPGTGQALVQMTGPRNIYTLNGLLSLEYERRWGKSGTSFDRFAYGLNMNFNGFVIDPRLIGLTVNGSFAQEFNSSANSTVGSFSVRVNLLRERPRRGLLHSVPQPIELRYEYDHFENGTRQNYGISMAYRLERKSPAYGEDFTKADKNQNTGDNNQNAGNSQQKIREKQGFLFPLPTFYFDYDRYQYMADNNDRTHGRLRLAAEARSPHVEYFAEYRFDNYDTSFSNTQFLQLQTNVHYYWKDTLTRLESYNIFFLEETGGEKTISVSDNTSLVKNLGPDGRDSLFLNGGAHYFSRDSKSAYGFNLNAGYNKLVSARFLNFSSAGVVYEKNEDTADHTETVRNSLQYRFSDDLLLFNDVTVGQSRNGPLYGLTLGLQVGRVFVLRPAYDYQFSEEFDREKITASTFHLDLSAPLLRRMSFFSQNYYRIVDVKGGFYPHKEKTLSLTSNLLWAFSRYNLSVGAAYIDGSTEGMSVGGVEFPKDTTKGILTVSANLATYLARRMNLNIAAYYQRENGGSARTIITPLLTWQWRRVSVTARYTLTMQNSTTEHRIFFRVTRQFQSLFRPFL